MDRIRKLIEKIEKYGIDNNVPIMSKDTIIELNKIINNEKVTSILEIGTAIGYSTICFANNENIKKVISIERDNLRYSIAKKNVLESNLSNIKLINDDAFNIEFN
ncbi:MAG: O-methyltransferase, partial [Tenericutes bacterium]|nr:O-methyltransferase [Mycoplasmatota bacterium]